MKKIAILTDSSCCWKEDIIKKYAHIYSMNIQMYFADGTNEIVDLDNNENFYNQLKNRDIKTSMISIGEMKEMWDKLLLDYDQVIFLGLSKGLSSQHSCAVLLSQESEYKDKVMVIDTEAVTEILLNMVIFTHNYIYRHNKDISNLQEEIDKLKLKNTGFIIPKSLDKLKSGGRIGPSIAALAEILKITPILIIEKGAISKFDKVRTFKKAIAKVADVLLSKHNNPNVNLILTRSDKETYDIVINTLKSAGFKSIKEYDMPKPIAIHTGEKAFGLTCWDGGYNNE